MSILGDVIQICNLRTFTFEEANELVPLLQRITSKHDAIVDRALKDQRYFIKTGAPESKVKECDTQVCNELVKWGSKVVKLGVSVFPNGFVGFNSGSFFYSWHYNEGAIKYYHEYTERPENRRRLPGIPTGGFGV